MAAAEAELRALLDSDEDAQIATAAWETTNLVTVALALAEAARQREETRGSHWREDFPERDDAHWAGHFDATMDKGSTVLTFRPTPPTDAPTALVNEEEAGA